MTQWLHRTLVMLAVALILAGCSSSKKSLDPFAGIGSPYYRGAGPMPKGGGKYQVGKPYQVAGRWFTPREQPGYDKVGLASWYGDAFHRRKTSNGEWFNMNDLTAAHPTLPLPSYAKVTNLENGQSVVVRINDRGPFVGTRLIDLSKASAQALGYRSQGTAQVRVQWIGVAPLNDDGRNLLAMNSALGQGARLDSLRQIADRGADSMPQIAGRTIEDDQYGSPGLVLASAGVESSNTSVARAYYVQVAAFTDQSNAASTQSMLDGVVTTRVVQAVNANGYVYRVQTSPVNSEAEAMSLLSEVQSIGFFDARLVSTQIHQVADTP